VPSPSPTRVPSPSSVPVTSNLPQPAVCPSPETTTIHVTHYEGKSLTEQEGAG
jgi:hypothetical protein